MKEPDANRTIAFMELLHAFQRVERVAHVPKRDRRENDTEHSYLLGMLAWYLADSLELPLDKNKLLKYSLAHDLVEVYAGDTYVFTQDKKEKETKRQREEEARVQIQKEFPEFESLHGVIEQYETQVDEESRFIRTLDKLMPVITNYIQDGRTWKEMNISFDLLVENKRGVINDHPQIRGLLEQIIAFMEKDRTRYFDR